MGRYIISTIFTVLVVLLLPSSLSFGAEYSAFSLEQKTVRHFAPNTDTGGEPQPERTEQLTNAQVTFSERKISVRTGQSEKLYDFEAGQLVLIDHEKKTYLPTSLYAIPAFILYEMQNQKNLFIKLPEASGNEDLPVLRPFDLEMMFSTVDGSEASDKIVKTTDNEKRSFKYENEEFASYVLSEHEISDHEEDLYAKYLLYEHALHPVVMADLVEQGHVFSSFSYRNHSVIPQLMESTYSLTDFTRSSDRTMTAPEGYQRIFAADDRLNEVIKLSMTQEEMALGDYKDLMEELLKQKDYLGSIMIFFEYSTHYGNSGDLAQLAPLIKKTLNEAPDNSGVKTLTAAIANQPKSKAGLEQAIKVIDDARRQDIAHGYILNVFLANYYDALGQRRIPQDLILEALEQNPFLGGAYKDLGDKYLRAYRMQDAWICWDRMRQLNPNHSLATPINNFEQHLKQRYPDYFM